MQDISEIKDVFVERLDNLESSQQLEELRLAYMGRKGVIKTLFADLKSLSPEERIETAQALNQFKDFVDGALKSAEAAVRKREEDRSIEEQWVDLSLPGTAGQCGARHPLTQIERRCLDVFGLLGFEFAEGPEVETPFHNFDALNIPEHHPARDMQDTFWLENNCLLRSHTSTVQIRVLENTRTLPIRIVSPGRVYRNESVDQTHLACFHQFEGLWVGEDVKFSHLKGTLEFIIRNIFGEDWAYRFKPKFYPYTEPSIGVDIRKKDGSTDWITILGAGMVHGNVFRATGHDPAKVSGFAFGLGISRMVTMAHHVGNMKSLYEGDLRVHERLARKEYAGSAE